MTFEEFESEAHRMWEEIPPEYKEGIDGIVVKRKAEVHPEHDDYYTMGMCFTEPYPSDYMGPETTRSILALYYGSFRQVAGDDPDFPWQEELWETITHELRHHLEYLAEDDELGGVDYAQEQTYLRGKDLDFDPWYFQSGIPLAPGVYRVEYDIYIEQRWKEADFLGLDTLEFDWDGKRWSIPRPDELGDVHFVQVEGVEAGGGWLELVLLRSFPLLARLKRAWRRDEVEVRESSLEARVVGEAPDSPGAEDGRPGRGAGGPPARAVPHDEGAQDGGTQQEGAPESGYGTGHENPNEEGEGRK